MEFVEGETLSKLLSRGPLPLDKALVYAGQITDALAAAHAKGIIHRDLKPGNIMMTPHGIKVLDFGLAKLGQIGSLSADGSSEVATMTEPITQSGSIVGTLHYMSPEQVEGKDVDERSDIFAFGAVLYEMVTGQRAFDGDSKAAIMAAVMKDQPPSVRQVRHDAPRSLDRLIRKCLEKKPDDRWQTARDLKPTIKMIDLDAVSSGSMSGASGAPISSSSSGLHAAPGRQWLVPALGVVALLAIGTLGWMLWNGSGGETIADAVQFELGAEGTANLSTTLAVSPDGRRLAFIATGVDGRTQLWIRTLETLEEYPLPGTEGAAGFPFWSWDSKSVVFTDGQALRKIDAAGGPAQILAQTGSPVVGGFWTPEGHIVLTLLNQGIFEIPAGGGEFTRLGDGFLPSPLPDGQHFLYLGDGGIHVATLPEPGAAEASLADTRIILPSDGNGVAMYSPAPRGEGYLLFQRPGMGSNGSFTLMAQPFDADALELLEAAVPVAENVPLAGFTVSTTGVLIYSTGALNLGSNLAAGSVGVLTWFDRSGVVQGTVGESAFYDFGVRLSPDGTRVAASRDGDIWVTDLERGGTTKLTFTEDVQEFSPAWSPDGTEIVYVDSQGTTRQGLRNPPTERVIRNFCTNSKIHSCFLWVAGPGIGGTCLFIASSLATSLHFLSTPPPETRRKLGRRSFS